MRLRLIRRALNALLASAIFCFGAAPARAALSGETGAR